MSRQDATRQAKIDKKTQLQEMGIEPYPYSFDKKIDIQAVRDAQMDTEVQTAGRITQIREHGKIKFIDIWDMSGAIQVLVHQQQISDQEWQMLQHTDRGDFLGVVGTLSTTRTQELTIKAQAVTFLGKSLRALPTEWNLASDKEARFRKRYIDMMINDQTRKVLNARWLILKEVRRFLQDQHNFIEVETPILQPLYGGTNAKPFTTHMNALDTDFYLRLAPELYLKRLIVSGYDKVFEIARNFRNEGIDQTHQPEFTMIEWYEAYQDYQHMMDVAETLLKHLIKTLNGQLKIEMGEESLGVDHSWPRISMTDALKKHTGIDFENTDDKSLQELLSQYNLTLKSSFTRGKALFELFDSLVTPKLINPTWIIDYPRDISPLAKQHRLKAGFAERFELYICGKELADGWSEITSGLDQRSVFENEQKNMRDGDDEAHPLDEDFLEAMEYGMPPLGGIGMGIDRLVMFLTNTWSIKEVIAFPTLRPIAKLPTEKQGTRDTQSLEKSGKNQDQRIGSNAKVDVNASAGIDAGAGASTNIATDANLDANSNVNSAKIDLPTREKAHDLLNKYIKNDKLRHHCRMVALALEAYANKLGENPELWYQTGLLHDLDWEMYPDEHPNYAVNNILKEYPTALKNAILAHAPDRTGAKAQSLLDRYLFACDELSGLMHAVSLMRPEGFVNMQYKSVKKKIKDKAFAANVSRSDIKEGIELINKDEKEHIEFLIQIFQEI